MPFTEGTLYNREDTWPRLMFLDEFEAAELVAAMFNLPEPEDDSDIERMEEKLNERIGIDLSTLANIATKLLPLCAEGVSPLTGKAYKGFARGHSFIAKISTPQNS